MPVHGRGDVSYIMTKSFWQDISISLIPSEIAEGKNYDVTIIGAGIAGLSTAYWLEKQNPDLRILIVDKAEIGAGASGRNAGFITCGSAEHFNKLHQQFGLEKACEIWQFSEINRELLMTEIIKKDSAAVDFYTTGSCTVAASSQDWVRYQTLARTMKDANIDVELVNADLLEQNYGVGDAVGGIQYKHDGLIHPIKLLAKIKAHLKNTKFLLNTRLHRYSKTNEAWELEVGNRKIETAQLIFCLNGFVDSELPELNAVVKPQRGQIVVTEPLPNFIKGPCYLTKHLCYFRQLPTGQLLVGGFRNHDLDAENTNADSVTEKIQAALSEFVLSYFKSTAAVKITYRWSGIMGFTSDGQMILGEHPHKKNLFMMAGCSGHGMGLSFHAAKVLVDSIGGKTIPGHLDLKRFLK